MADVRQRAEGDSVSGYPQVGDQRTIVLDNDGEPLEFRQRLISVVTEFKPGLSPGAPTKVEITEKWRSIGSHSKQAIPR